MSVSVSYTVDVGETVRRLPRSAGSDKPSDVLLLFIVRLISVSVAVTVVVIVLVTVFVMVGSGVLPEIIPSALLVLLAAIASRKGFGVELWMAVVVVDRIVERLEEAKQPYP